MFMHTHVMYCKVTKVAEWNGVEREAMRCIVMEWNRWNGNVMVM